MLLLESSPAARLAVQVLRTRIVVPGLPQPLRVLHIAAPSAGSTAADAAWLHLHAQVSSLNPHLIALAGDLVATSGETHWSRLSLHLAALRVPFGLTASTRDMALPPRRRRERDPRGSCAAAYDEILRRFGRSADFESFDFPGVRVAFLDNGEGCVSRGQRQQLALARRANLPLVLCCAAPLIPPAPRENRLYRYFRENLAQDPLVAAVLAPGPAFDPPFRLPAGAPHLTTPPLSTGYARLLTLEPPRVPRFLR